MSKLKNEIESLQANRNKREGEWQSKTMNHKKLVLNSTREGDDGREAAQSLQKRAHILKDENDQIKKAARKIERGRLKLLSQIADLEDEVIDARNEPRENQESIDNYKTEIEELKKNHKNL